MDEVAVSTFDGMIEICDLEGPPFSTFLEGVSYSEEHLRNNKARISWNEYCKIMENIGRVWDDEKLENIGRKYIHAKSMKIFKTAYQIIISPKSFYSWMYSPKSPGRGYFTCVYSSVIDLGPNRLLGILQMEDGYKPCREFYIITKGVMEELSTLIGFARCKVDMSLIENAAYYDIKIPEGFKVFSFINHIIRLPFNFWTVKRKLKEALESLQGSYVEIVHAKNNLEKRVEERTAELKEAQEIRDRIFANISHEFRTPLTLIKNPVEMLLSNERRNDLREQYKLILQNTNRLLILVNQLLDLSKIESGMMSLHVRNIDLVEEVRICAASFESAASLSKISFSLTLPDKPVKVWVDRDCIEKILINLLSNAFKFTPEGGSVTVTIHPLLLNEQVNGDFIEIKVSDTGIGIPTDQLDKIFERFYQVNSSNSNISGGTGIGLAHTKELVELHNGEIIVASEEGTGSTFTVKLRSGKDHFSNIQIVEEEEKEEVHFLSSTGEVEITPIMNENELMLNESKPLLLIIDDSSEMRKFMRMILDESYSVSEAENGIEGIQCAIESIPDIIISDVMMPKMNGYEVCSQLKTDERTSHIPVILLTAKASMESKLEGLETGADAYLTKPFNQKELSVRVKNLIAQRKLLREKFGREQFIKSDLSSIPSLDKAFLNKVKEAIEKNLGDETFSVEQLASKVALSRSQLHRKLCGLVNHTPGEFILAVRLEHAAYMIKQNTGSISEIAYSTGFNTPNYFAKCFRKKFGCSPTEYRAKLTGELK